MLEDVGGPKQQIKNLELDNASLKAENKGWIKKSGIYLGLLASAVAVPKAAKETWTLRTPTRSANDSVG